MIHFEHVAKFYKPDIVALEDVSFDIQTGEFLFLVGPSGAGKSTLIRLLIREELPSQGRILFEDADVTKIKRQVLPFYRQQIGVVFQDYKLIDTKTIRENIEFALEITGKTDKEIDDTANSLLDVVSLSNRQTLFPYQLSGGEKQRAGIARALANDPKVLIADEPTGNLDPKTSEEIMTILETVNNWGTTVLIATHDKDIVDAMNKRVVRLENGTVACDQIGKYDSETTAQSSIEEQPPSIPSETGTAGSDMLASLSVDASIRKNLLGNGITSVNTLLDMSEQDIIDLKHIGTKKAQKIIEALQTYLSEENNGKK